MNTTTGETRINGINIHYRLRGSGEPLLMIMGLGGNADWWSEDFLDPLSGHFQVAVFDNRGTGRSDKPDGPYTIPVMASDALRAYVSPGLDLRPCSGCLYLPSRRRGRSRSFSS
ncbi:MAG: alpha/beta fold hydrolase, partial [Actinomycetota bacterium]